MIPISRDQKLEKTIDGVTYLFTPPVGDVEMLIAKTFDFGQDMTEIKANYSIVEKELEREYKGKRKPAKDQWTKLIEERLLTKTSGLSSFERDIKNMNDVIDVAMIGWESTNKDVPSFPKEGKPSTMLVMALKRELYEWYLGNLKITESESKN